MSDSPNITRKLAAVMFTDIAGFTKSMSSDENKTLSLLEKKESILKPLIKSHNGTYVKGTGDGSLSYFHSATDAAVCSVKLQEATYDDDDMNIRVGIHVGDIVFKGDDVFGDGVNIAARLESMAAVGGVCVSSNVYDELINKEEFNGVSLGLQSLKGVGRLIETFALKGDKLNHPNPDEYIDNRYPCCDGNKEIPSIAIIPFRNKGKKKDEFYAYGICNELISDCSSAGQIRVASLEQVEELHDLTVKEKAKKLNVRYITTGTLWRMDDIFQLSIELYDSKESEVIWSDNWQENWDNLPMIKSSLSDGILKVLNITLKVEKIVETTNPEAYEFYLRGKYIFERRKNELEIIIALEFINDAIKKDKKFLSARVFLASIYIQTAKFNKALEILRECQKESRQINNKLIESTIYNHICTIYLEKGEYSMAIKMLNEAKNNIDKISIENDQYWVKHYRTLGRIYYFKSNFKKSIDAINKAIQYIDKENNVQKYLVTLNLSIMCNQKLKKFKKAISIGIDAKNLANQKNVYGIEGKISNNIACNYKEAGLYIEALDYYNHSMSICEEINDYG